MVNSIYNGELSGNMATKAPARAAMPKRSVPARDEAVPARLGKLLSKLAMLLLPMVEITPTYNMMGATTDQSKGKKAGAGQLE